MMINHSFIYLKYCFCLHLWDIGAGFVDFLNLLLRLCQRFWSFFNGRALIDCSFVTLLSLMKEPKQEILKELIVGALILIIDTNMLSNFSDYGRNVGI